MLVSFQPQPVPDFPEACISGDMHHIWDIMENYKCPVIGTCLTEAEHRKVVKKSGIRTKGLKSYEIHSIVMSHLGDENPVSRRVESYLKHKYKADLEVMKTWDAGRIAGEWEKRYATGEIGSLLFHVSLRKDISMDLLRHVFGEVHMLSHAIIEKVSCANRELFGLRDKVEQLTKQLEEQRKQSRSLAKENRKLVEELKSKSVVEKHAVTGETTGLLESPPSLMQEADAEKRELEKKNNELLWRLEKLEVEKEGFREQIREHEALNVHLRGDIEELISHFTTVMESPEANKVQTGSKPDLSSQRILIVGGMTKIRHLYQHLIESSGGHFDYHDGYMKNGSNNLVSKINRADLILCPVNCNSHNACLKVKKLCCKYNKRLKILSNASVSTISSVLFTDDGEEPLTASAPKCNCSLPH